MSNANTTTTTIDDLTHQSANPFPVEPTGFLIGSYFACILYGVHLTQFRTYFRRYKYDSTGTRLLVLWIWVLSTLQVLIILSSGWKYFVGGLVDKGIWGEFWWPLSFQDGLVGIRIVLLNCAPQPMAQYAGGLMALSSSAGSLILIADTPHGIHGTAVLW